MIRTTDALESDCKGKLVHHHSAKRLSQVATDGAHRRQVDRKLFAPCDPIHRPIYPTHKSMSPQLSKKRAFLACSAQAAFSNLPFFCPNNSCDFGSTHGDFFTSTQHIFFAFCKQLLVRLERVGSDSHTSRRNSQMHSQEKCTASQTVGSPFAVHVTIHCGSTQNSVPSSGSAKALLRLT